MSNARQPRKVLGEEDYTNTLSAIVQRDYFPELSRLTRQAAVLEKRSQGDFRGAVAVRRAARQLEEHEQTLADQESQDEHDCDDERLRKTARPLHQESITGFHARVTNEDDAEFDANQKQEIQNNRNRIQQLFLPKGKTKTSDDGNDNDPHLLGLASDQFEAPLNRIAAHEWKAPPMRPGLFFNPTPVRVPDHADQQTKLLANHGNDDQNLSHNKELQRIMPPPPAKGKKVVRTRKEDGALLVGKQLLVEYVPKISLIKKIEPSQTRFPSASADTFQGRPSCKSPSSVYSESEATDGSITDASTDLDAPMHSIDHERHRRDQRQRRAQQSYVVMTPLIVPGGSGGNDSPIMTWGSVDSTPLVLSGQEHFVESDNQVTPSFSLPQENHREHAARIAESELDRRAKRAKSSKSTRKRRKLSSATPSTAGLLTPAAQALLEKAREGKRTPSVVRSRSAFGSALRQSYTPTPQRSANPKGRNSRGSSKRPAMRDSAYKDTPLASKHSNR